MADGLCTGDDMVISASSEDKPSNWLMIIVKVTHVVQELPSTSMVIRTFFAMLIFSHGLLLPQCLWPCSYTTPWR